MFSYSSTKEVKSKVHEGVNFTVRVMSEGFRTKILLGLIETMAAIRQYQTDLTRLNEELPRTEDGNVDAAKAAGSETLMQLQNLTDRILVLRKEKVHPVYAREGFVSTSNYALDGDEQPGIEAIRLRGSEAFYNEIVEAIRAEVELTDEQKQNLELPTTSGALVEEAKINTTALSVETTGSTEIETAIDTILTM